MAEDQSTTFQYGDAENPPATPELREFFPEYFVSRDGRIFTQSRGNLIQMKPFPSPDGYLRIFLVSPEGKYVSWRVSRAVAYGWVGLPPSPRHQVRHLNGIKTDNRADNLAWGTNQQSARDRIFHGTQTKGIGHPNHKLSELQVVEIRNSNESAPVLARRYGVSSSAVVQVRSRATWRHIGVELRGMKTK